MFNKITKIKAQKQKGRYNVYINGKYAFPISEAVIIKYRVFKGMEVDHDLKLKLIYADGISKLYNKGIDYLATQLRTEAEVRSKLRTFSHDDTVIDAVIKHLKQEQLINDQNYANSYVRTKMRINGFGPNKIKLQLRLKHIDPNLIEDAIADNYHEQQQIQNGVEQAQKIFKKHSRDAFKKQIQKVKTGLIRQGYEYQDIDKIIKQLHLEPDLNKQQELLERQGHRIWEHNHIYDEPKRILKTKQKLYRKGFSIDEIDNLIDRLVQN